jgi:voltage-gated potassium channel Kch
MTGRFRRVLGEVFAFLHRHEWAVIGVLALLGLILGFIGFMKINGSLSITDVLYRDLQLLGFEGGFLEGEPTPWEIEVARLLLPLVAAYAALKGLAILFREQLAGVRIALRPPHVVIAGLGERGWAVASSLRQEGHRVVAIEKDRGNPYVEPCRKTGAVVLIGDATDLEVLRAAKIHRARHVVAVCGQDHSNAEVAIRARELARARRPAALTCVVHIVDPQLCMLLKTYEIGSCYDKDFRLDCFNMYESGAGALLKQHPLSPEGQGSGEQQHLVIVGLGRLGRSLLVQAARDWGTARVQAEGRLRVTAVDRQAAARVAALVGRYPQLSSVCELSYRDIDLESSEFGRAGFLFDSHGRPNASRVYVTVGDDSLAMASALKLRQRLAGHKVRIVVRMSRNSGLGDLLAREPGATESSDGLQVFGLLDEVFDVDSVLGGTYEIMARAIHEEYARAEEAAGQTSETNATLVPWDALPESLRESNRDQAAHIGAKLGAVGCGIVPWSDWEAESFQFTHHEIEMLAAMEHDRWVAERVRSGWTYRSGTKDAEKKQSPYLVPWDDLEEGIKELDRDTVRRMPIFLAGAGFQIVRVGAAPPATC